MGQQPARQQGQKHVGLVADYPSEDDVRASTTFGPYTGNMTLPAEADVESGVQFGTDGTEYTGSLSTSAAVAWADREAGNDGDYGRFSHGGKEFLFRYDASLAEWVPPEVYRLNATWTLRGQIDGDEANAGELTGYASGSIGTGSESYNQSGKLLLTGNGSSNEGIVNLNSALSALGDGFGLFWSGLVQVTDSNDSADQVWTSSMLVQDGDDQFVLLFVRDKEGTNTYPVVNDTAGPGNLDSCPLANGSEIDLQSAEGLVQVLLVKAADRTKCVYVWVDGELAVFGQETAHNWGDTASKALVLRTGPGGAGSFTVRDHKAWTY